MPAAAFRSMLSKSKGSAVGIPLDEGNVHKTANTGATPLLCSECEAHFNRTFDAPMSNALKRLESGIIKYGYSQGAAVSHDELAQAIISMFWRTCVSDAFLYSRTNLPTIHLNSLENIIKSDKSEALKFASIRIARLYDPSEAITQDLMADLVLTPKVYIGKNRITNKSQHIMLDTTIFGFLINCNFPKLKYSKLSQEGFLRRGRKALNVPKISIFDYPPLKQILMNGYSKNISGKVSKGIGKKER